MGRLFFLLLINAGAYLVLRRLWPEVRTGWRHRALTAAGRDAVQEHLAWARRSVQTPDGD